jgi:RNA recognition motif-containing protein
MATVEFASKDDVRAAIEKFDHYDFRGRQIFVRQDYPPPEKKEEASFRSRQDDYRSDYPPKREEYREKRREAAAPPKPGTEIFVGNLPFSVNWQALKDIMREAGEVVRADVRLDSWGKSRGFGTVVFATTEAASKAIEMFQGYEIEGRKLDTRPGKTGLREDRGTTDSYRKESAPVKKNSDFTQAVQGNGDPSDTIYVSNLPFVTNNEDLYELFETVGRVAQAEIQYTEKGKPSGNAVVKFELAELSASAIQSLDNYVYGGRNLSITYAKRSNGVDTTVPEGESDHDVEVEVAEGSEATEATNLEAPQQPESTENAPDATDADIDVDTETA